MSKLKILISLSLILIIIYAVFSPSLKNNFVNWDDDRYVTENEVIRSLTIKNVKNIFASFTGSGYQPLPILLYTLEYHFFKNDPLGYHAINISLHLLNCLLVFWMIIMISDNIAVSFLTAILFGIHPLNVESVTWISAAKELICAMFTLAAIISYLAYYKNNRNYKYYGLSITFFVLSFFVKVTAILLPFALILIDYLFHRKRNRAVFAEKAPFFAVSCIFVVITVIAHYASGVSNRVVSYNPLNISMLSAYEIIFYLNKIFVPIKLSCLYPYPDAKDTFFLLYSLVAVLIIFMAILFSRRYTRKIVFGSIFFLIFIFPVFLLQLVPIGETIIADRYVYISSVGIFYVLAEGFFWLYSRKIKYSPQIRIMGLVILIGIFGILGSLTWKRCQVWRNSLSLWNDVLKNYPNLATAYNSRGADFLAKKEYAKAYSDFINTLSIDPDYYEAYFNLGSLANSLGNQKEAIRLFNRTLEINPAYLRAYDMLIVIYGNMGYHAQVMELSRKVVKDNPNYALGYCNVCSAYANLGSFKEAIAYCQKALKLDPGLSSAHMSLSAAYFYIKDYNLAIMHCDKAINLGYAVPIQFLESLKPYRK